MKHSLAHLIPAWHNDALVSDIVPYDSGFVPLGELSKVLKLHRTNVRKYALKNGFRFARMRTPQSKLTLCLSYQDVAALKQLRRDQGFRV